MKLFSKLSLFILVQSIGFSPILAQTVVDAEKSSISSSLFGNIQMDLALSDANSPQVRYLEHPYRLVLDFKDISFGDLPVDFGHDISGVQQINHGATLAGSRMVLTFERPYILKSMAQSKESSDGITGLRLMLKKTSDAEFSKLAEDLRYSGGDLDYHYVPEPQGEPDLPLIVIDPGHGGIDPGAVRGGVSEKNVTLDAARIISSVLLLSERYQIAMTRDKDVFVSLINRRRLGEHLGADLMLSIHADTVEVGDAQGSTIYLISKQATSKNAEKFAKFENRVDLFAGEYLEGNVSDLTNVLTDLAQASSNEKASRLAAAMQLQWSNGKFARTTKIESAAFAVLKAPEVPSLLLELGYLSNNADRASLQNQEWLTMISEKLLRALDQIYYPNLTND